MSEKHTQPEDKSINKNKPKTSITFLFDKSNDWIRPYFSKEILPDIPEYEYHFSFSPEDIVGQDIVFILGYTKILDKEFLSAQKLCLVVHESDLPKGKGFCPVQWQVLEGNSEIPICLLEAAEQVDSGDIILQKSFILDGSELYEEIRDKQGKASLDIIREFLELYPDFKREEQVGEESFYTKRTPKDGELDITKSIDSQFDLLRIGNNQEWPSFFLKNGVKYILKIEKED